MKRYLAVFLCLCLIGMGGVLRSAKAEEVSIIVGDTELEQDGDSVTGGSGTATLTYENGNPVLTLDNYIYSGQGIGFAAIWYHDNRYDYDNNATPLTIRLVGNSSVTHVSDNSYQSSVFESDFKKAEITIEGTGSLTLQHSGNDILYSNGILVEGPLTIRGGRVEVVGVDINSTNVMYTGESYGIHCYKSLKIEGGTVIATGGSVTATVTESSAYSYGIYVQDNIEITGGAVEASGGVVSQPVGDQCSEGIHGGKMDIGDGIDYVRAKGYSGATNAQIKNAVAGTGWTDYAGTEGITSVSVHDNYTSVLYKHLYFERPVISAKATFKVKNGAWNDETTADKPVTLTGRQGDTLKLKEGDIPPVGSKPAEHYKAGSWNPVPDTETAITGNDNVYTYTYVKKNRESYTVTFRVVNGEWDNGGSADQTVTLSGDEDENLSLKAGDIPAVGSNPAQYYKAGSWDVTPSTDTAITEDKTYTYTYEKIPVTLSVTDTKGTEHKKQSGEDAVITVKGSPDDRDTYKSFEKASVDGKELKIGRDAEKAEGSLILTVRSEYLDTLSEGDHKVTVAFSGGTVETTVTIKAAAAKPKPVPKTGDTAALLLWGGLVILGVMGMAVGMKRFSLGKKK